MSAEQDKKYTVVCGCGKKIKFSANDVQHREDKYSTDTAVKEKVVINRFWVVCKKCGGHPNVARVIPEIVKTIMILNSDFGC